MQNMSEYPVLQMSFKMAIPKSTDYMFLFIRNSGNKKT